MVGQDLRVDPPYEVAQLLQCDLGLAAPPGHQGGGAGRLRDPAQFQLGEAQGHAEGDQLLLRTVVQVPLDAPPFGFEGVDQADPGAGELQDPVSLHTRSEQQAGGLDLGPGEQGARVRRHQHPGQSDGRAAEGLQRPGDRPAGDQHHRVRGDGPDDRRGRDKGQVEGQQRDHGEPGGPEDRPEQGGVRELPPGGPLPQPGPQPGRGPGPGEGGVRVRHGLGLHAPQPPPLQRPQRYAGDDGAQQEQQPDPDDRQRHPEPEEQDEDDQYGVADEEPAAQVRPAPPGPPRAEEPQRPAHRGQDGDGRMAGRFGEGRGVGHVSPA